MEDKQIVAVLCVFGFLKEFRPSEPYISPFLNGHWKNFTEIQINREIFPVGTYSTLVLLVIVFLLTDWLKYKPIIVLQGLSGLITWALLAQGQGIPLMQVVQVCYGLFTASDVAYVSYMYAKVDKQIYQQATARVKTAVLIGKASSGLVSQLLVMYNLLDYQQLNYVTLGALFFATVWALFLPAVHHSTYFNKLPQVPTEQESELISHSKVHVQVEPEAIYEISSTRKTLCCDFAHVLEDFYKAFKNKNVVKWSIWWALAMCGYLQVTYYMQLLWQNIINEEDSGQLLYHGFSNCAHSLIGCETAVVDSPAKVPTVFHFVLAALCTYFVGYLRVKWDVYGEIALAVCSILQGCVVISASQSSNLIFGYIIYIIFRVLYQTSSTVASSELAKNLQANSYALVFGVNTFIALLAQSTMTVVVIDLLKTNIRTQFLVYGVYYLFIGIGFTVAGTRTVYKYTRR